MPYLLSSPTTQPNGNAVLDHAVNHVVSQLLKPLLLPGVLLLVLVMCWAVVMRSRAAACERRLARSGINEVDMMTGTQFEHFLASLFRRLGYDAQVIGGVGDFGADLILTRNGVRVAVQAKCWNKTVGPGAVQEVNGARSYHHCQGALVVTNHGFTQAAAALAKACGVELWGRPELLQKMNQLGFTAKDPVVVDPLPAPTPRPARDCCARCGTVVSFGVRNFCLSRPQRFGGQVFCQQHQKTVPPTLQTPPP